jgi:hypothetical protein
LSQGPSGWLVDQVETARSFTPIARFGTTAQYQEPEAAPVEGQVPAATTTIPETPENRP